MATKPSTLEGYFNTVEIALHEHLNITIADLPDATVIRRAFETKETPDDLVAWVVACDRNNVLLTQATLDGYNTYRIRTLNFLARTAMGIASRLYVTAGISALSPDEQSAIREKVELYDDFTPDNNPYGEEDFGNFEHNGRKIFFKIDYYDKSLEYGSEDPANPAETARVLTIMFAHEY